MIFFGKRRTSSAPYMLILYSVFFNDAIGIFMRYPCLKIMSVFHITLIKIHKENNPVRPIISAINSPTYNLSKILSKFLYEHLKKPFSHINNSLELKEKLEGIMIPDGFEIISLDVVSLLETYQNILFARLLKNVGHNFIIIHIYHAANS